MFDRVRCAHLLSSAITFKLINMEELLKVTLHDGTIVLYHSAKPVAGDEVIKSVKSTLVSVTVEEEKNTNHKVIRVKDPHEGHAYYWDGCRAVCPTWLDTPGRPIKHFHLFLACQGYCNGDVFAARKLFDDLMMFAEANYNSFITAKRRYCIVQHAGSLGDKVIFEGTSDEVDAELANPEKYVIDEGVITSFRGYIGPDGLFTYTKEVVK